MDRSIAYTSEQGRSTDFLFAQRATMIGLGKLAKAMLGASTVVEGLSVSPTSPAGLNVLVGSGQIYSLQDVDVTAYGALPADTSDTIVKQGLLMTAQTLATPAPTTTGYSINYLIQATYQDQDTNVVVLPYFNSANPLQPLAGQNNSGVAQPTERQGVCVVAVKAGAAATTGSQTTPAPDPGYTALAVVTVANGQTTVTSSNIVVVAGAPVITNILQMLQSGSAMNAADTGAANAYAMALTPAPAAITPGMLVGIRGIVAGNNGASTFNLNGLGALPIQGPGAAALQGGEFVTGGSAILQANAGAAAWNLIWTSGAQPVAAASHSGQAVNLGQLFIGNRKAVFTANGTYTVPPSVTQIWVSGCAGGGGGAGGGGTVGSSGFVGGGGGGGGGAGQSAIKQPISVTPGNSLSIAIGAPGAGGAGGANTGANGANGTAGGNTVLTDSTSATTLLTLAGGGGGGGGGGQTSTTAGPPSGGPGGACGSGYANGSFGSDGNYAGNGGDGASNPFGGGGGSGRAANGAGINGNASGGYGSGGGGGGGAYGAAANAGGNGAAGAPGFFVIEW